MRPPPGARVLIVDDDDDLAELIAGALRRMGSRVRTAGDARQALDAALDFDPHVVVVDLHLPDCDGHELGDRLRAQSGRAVQIIALTADDSVAAQVRSDACGFAAHLIKPASLRDVARLIALVQMGP